MSWAISGSITAASSTFDALINYEKLGHRIELEDLRAGNHDESGVNDYYFSVGIAAIVSTQDEKKLELAQRKKVTSDLGHFGEIRITALSFWEKGEVIPKLVVTGEQIRELARKCMREFRVLEDETAILVEVFMHEHNKRFGFLGEDRLVGKASYFVIPETFPHKASTKDLALSITDQLGVGVKFKVLFKVNNPEAESEGQVPNG